MQIFFRDLLNLGGIYFILSFFLLYDFIQLILFFVFLIFLIILSIKKQLKFLSFFETHPYLETYFGLLGVLSYIDLVFFRFPEIIAGYQYFLADIKGIEYHSILLTYISYGYQIKAILFVLILVIATLLNIKRKLN